MNSARKTLSVLLALPAILGLQPLASQTLPDTLKLPEFEIRSNFLSESQGFKRVRLDSSVFIPNLAADLSKLISEHSTIFIKSYGAGTLATPSFRGTSAQHTQVEWNGINLNSPMLGQMDFSQVPVSQFDGLEILYGSAGISRSSGAFGGVIDLVTAPDWNNRIAISAGQTVASFKTYTSNFQFSAGGRSLQAHTRANFTRSESNFPFTNDEGQRVRQQNASYWQGGISQEIFWNIRDRGLLTARIWYSQDDRNLPPTTQTLDTSKIETLRDRSLRAVLEHKLLAGQWTIHSRTAINDQSMKYDNNVLDLHSAHHVFSWINRIRVTWKGIRKMTLRGGADFTYDRVNSDAYDAIRTRTTISFFGEVNHEIAPWIKTSLVIREDVKDGKAGKLIPALAMEVIPARKAGLSLNASLSRNFRYPTLNELYWNGAGNPDLSPEMNYSGETGLIWKLGSPGGILFTETALSAYYSRIYDMITWTQLPGSSLFRPENVEEIHARGMEAGFNAGCRPGHFRILLKSNYNLCISTYEKAGPAYQSVIGNQQFYIPRHTLNASLTAERWRFFFTWEQQYTSERYTGKDNLSLMPAYHLSNVVLGKKLQLNQINLSLQVEINNLFGLDYQSVASRPMPGRNAAFSLRIRFDRKTDDKKTENDFSP